MAIAVQDIVDEMKSALDAEGSDYYLFDQDFKPAINRSIRWLLSVLNAALSSNKFSEEQFRDVSVFKLFITSTFSRIQFDPAELGHEVWTILAVLPMPTYYPTPKIPNPLNPEDSVYLDYISHIDSDYYCHKLSIEEWQLNKKNPFKPGYEGDQICDDLKTYAYLPMNDYSSTAYSPVREIEIRPKLVNKIVTVNYVKDPGTVDLIGDSIDFPNSFFNLIVEKALAFIAVKQGDNTTLYSVSERDVQILMNILS